MIVILDLGAPLKLINARPMACALTIIIFKDFHKILSKKDHKGKLAISVFLAY